MRQIKSLLDKGPYQALGSFEAIFARRRLSNRNNGLCGACWFALEGEAKRRKEPLDMEKFPITAKESQVLTRPPSEILFLNW